MSPHRKITALAAALVAVVAMTLPSAALALAPTNPPSSGDPTAPTATAPSTSDRVVLYADANLTGQSYAPTTSASFSGIIGCSFLGCSSFDNRASSMHVPAYTCVTLFDGPVWSGETRRYCGTTVAPYGAALTSTSIPRSTTAPHRRARSV